MRFSKLYCINKILAFGWVFILEVMKLDLLPVKRENVWVEQQLVHDPSVVGLAYPEPEFYKVIKIERNVFVMIDQDGAEYDVIEPGESLYNFKKWQEFKAEHCTQTIALHILHQTTGARPGQSVRTLCEETITYDSSIAAKVQETIFLCKNCLTAFARLTKMNQQKSLVSANIVWEFYNLPDYRPAHGVPADRFYALHKQEWTRPSEE